MVLKYFKGSVIKQYRIGGELEGHIFIFGRIGAGKSVSGKSIVEGYKDNYGYKVWDLYGGERHEGVYWAVPSQDKIYWDKLKLLGHFDEDGPKQYQVNFLYPYFESKIPNKLPKKGMDVTSTVFTIPLKDITIEDVKMVMGNLSDTNKYVIDEIIHTVNKKDTCAVLHDLAKKLKGINTTVFKNFLLPMYREKFLMNYDCETNLDLKAEANKKDVVSVLCLEFVPEKFHLFIINYFIKRMADMIDENKIGKRNINFIRESATFFRATEDSVLEDNFKIFRTNMAHYIRYGRRGMHFALDCQSANEVRGLVQGSEDYLLMFKTTAFRDKEEMCEELKKERRMRQDQIADLGFLNKGECYIAETGKVVKKVKITLPRSAYWKKEYPNFYKSHWERFGGEWKNINEIKEHIDAIYDKNKDDYFEPEKPKKEETEIKGANPEPIIFEKPTPVMVSEIPYDRSSLLRRKQNV